MNRLKAIKIIKLEGLNDIINSNRFEVFNIELAKELILKNKKALSFNEMFIFRGKQHEVSNFFEEMILNIQQQKHL